MHKLTGANLKIYVYFVKYCELLNYSRFWWNKSEPSSINNGPSRT